VDPTATVRNRSRMLGATTAVLFSMFAAGCGGSGGSEGAPAATPSSESNQRAAYIECLRKNGVDPADLRKRKNADSGADSGEGSDASPSASPDASADAGQDQPLANLRKARQACRSLAPKGGKGGKGGNKAFRDCLKQRGVTLPLKKEEEGEERDPKVAEAVQACRPLRKNPSATPAPSASPS
jgi:hypothetical protein